MADQRKRMDVTSADSKLIGFEYQYLYFMIRLLQLSRGEEVGYEALDDVHTISYREHKTFFFQLKHTVSATAKGNQSNLTKFSEDLWKTLSNWCKLISDVSEGRNLKTAQKAFIEISNFKLVINRNLDRNDVILHIKKLQNKEISGAQFMQYLNCLQGETQDQSIKRYIDDVMGLGTVLTPFVHHIEFINAPDNLFSIIRDGIRDKMIPEEYVNDVLSDLYLQLKEDFFDKVQNGQHQIISYSEWRGRYQGVFNKYRITLLPLRTYNPVLPDHLEQQNFVKELIEIGELNIDDDCGLFEIAELTGYYLQVKLQLEDWYQEGRITYSVLQKFHDDSIHQWKNIHRASHRSTSRDCNMDFQNALTCFDNVMNEKLTLLSTELGMIISNGEFIKLAEEKQIGWKYSWKDRYYLNGNQYTEKQ